MMNLLKNVILTLSSALVCEKILAAAASVMSGSDVPLEILLHFIASLPREYTDYGGMSRLCSNV